LADAFFSAFVELSEPARLMFLFIGVLCGLVIGVIPGLSGIIGMALLVPFTYNLDAYAAIALLLGMGSVTTTSDTISAVLFGVPGTVGSAATVIDGHAMARNGESGRAFGAAFSASMIGGVVGAVALALAIPVMQPVVRNVASPELFAIAVFGLSMVATLSAANPLRGLLSVCAGLAVALIGLSSQTATDRWTYGTVYLWEGIPLVPLFLGLFGIPELFVLSKSKSIVDSDLPVSPNNSLFAGIRDTLSSLPLVARMSALGAILGAIPGIGVSIIDWIAYGIANRTVKGDHKFGKGDVRGVIAPEAANNAKEGGALVPTVAFGIPGSASMTILLGALMVQGIVPGPDMLTKHLDLTVVMVFSIGLANIMGTVICLGLSPYFARLSLVSSGIIVPVVLVFVVLGAFQASRDAGDFAVLFVFGIIGLALDAAKWSKPAFALGFILGPSVERYFFISHSIYGWSWLTRPIVMIILALAIASFFRYLPEWLRALRQRGGDDRPNFSVPAMFMSICSLAFSLFGLMSSKDWPLGASLFPIVVFSVSVALSAILFLNDLRLMRTAHIQDVPLRNAICVPGWHIRYLANIGAFLVCFLCFGWFLSIIGFLLANLKFRAKTSTKAAFFITAGATLVIWLIFDLLLAMPWPDPLLFGFT